MYMYITFPMTGTEQTKLKDERIHSTSLFVNACAVASRHRVCGECDIPITIDYDQPYTINRRVNTLIEWVDRVFLQAQQGLSDLRKVGLAG